MIARKVRAHASADPVIKGNVMSRIKRALRQYDHMGVGCIDIATWDLEGKQSDLRTRAISPRTSSAC